MDAERRIFLAEAGQCLSEPIRVDAVRRADRHLDHRFRHEHAFQRTVTGLVGIGITAGAVHADHRHDIAGLGAIDFRAFVGVHPHDAAEAIAFAGSLVIVHLPFFDPALVNPHERELTVRIVHDLEGHADKGCLRIRRQRHRLLWIVHSAG